MSASMSDSLNWVCIMLVVLNAKKHILSIRKNSYF